MDPRGEYSSRRERWTAREGLAQPRFRQIGNARLAVGLIAAGMAWLVFARDLISIWWLLAPLSVFIAFVVWHQRVLRERTLAGRAIRYYTHGLGRLNDEWAEKGNEPGERFRHPAHVYSEDLDLFGKGSLFEMLSTARPAEAAASSSCGGQKVPAKEYCLGTSRPFNAEYGTGDHGSVCVGNGVSGSACSSGPGQGVYKPVGQWITTQPWIFNHLPGSWNIVHGTAFTP